MASNLPAESNQPTDLEAARQAAVQAESQRMRALAEAAAYQPPAAQGDDESPVDISRYISAVLRYKLMLIALAMAGGVAGFLAARMQRASYTAQATIWVQPGAGSNGPLQSGQLLQSTSWLELIRSFVVLDSVIRSQKLFVVPKLDADSAVLASFDLQARFAPGTYVLKVDETGRSFTLSAKGTGAVVQRGAPGDSIGTTVGFNWVPAARHLTAGREIEFNVITPRQAALGILDKLQTRLPVVDGNFIRMSLTGDNPSRTAATLNAIADQFVRVAADLKSEQLRQLSATLNEQLAQSYANLQRAEIQLESFRVGTITLPSDQGVVAAGLQQTQAPALTSYFTLRTEFEQLRRDREAIEEVLRAGPSGVTSITLEPIGSVSNSPAIMQAVNELTTKTAAVRALLTRLTEENPQVVRLRAEIDELQRVLIPAELRRLVAELQARERQSADRIATTERDLRQIPVRAIEEARLAREMTIAAQLYSTLQQRYSESRLAEASSIPDVRVLDPAVTPNRPFKSAMPLLVLLGIGGGLGAAIALALVLDKFDSRVRYPTQVTNELGLHILGAIPRVKSNGKGPSGEDAAQVVEALRSIRLNLLNAFGSAGPLVTTITSPGSGDGKSFLSSNLALAFADAGHRTLLIDGDIRRGTLHRVLGANRKPGLLDFLGGQAERESVIQATRIPSVDFIGCGTRKMGGPELLASPQMSQLLIQLRNQYQVIIVDSPPLGAGVDPLVLGTLTGSLLLVLRTGVTNRDLAASKLEALDRLPIRVLGAVLNDVKAEGVYKYYSYLPGYRAEDEIESETPRLPAFSSNK